MRDKSAPTDLWLSAACYFSFIGRVYFAIERKYRSHTAVRLSEIHVPTLIIVGDQDVELILTIAETLEKGIVGAKKVVIPGTAQHLNMEKPEEFNRVVIEFLEQVDKAR